MIFEKILKITCGDCSGICFSEVLNSSIHPMWFTLFSVIEIIIGIGSIIILVMVLLIISKKIKKKSGRKINENIFY